MSSVKKVYALSTARDGSKSVKYKNCLLIHNKPLYLHNLLESLNTPEILGTYLSTDIPQAIANGPIWGYEVIERPEELCQDKSTHTDTIYHGLREIEKRTGDTIDVLVVMLGNTMNMDRNVIKEALEMLEADPELDSVITVIKANHFNPMRAYVDDGKGGVTTYLSQQEIAKKVSERDLSDKNSAGDILFQNGLWIIRRHAIVNAKSGVGMLPFQWFGERVKYIVQDPRLQEVDDEYQIRLLN